MGKEMQQLNTDQLTEQVLKHRGEIGAIQEKLSSAHKRIDENDRITEGIHKLASNVEVLALQVKQLTERMDTSVERIEAGLDSQGARIGVLEKEPGHKWKALAAQVTSLIVAAIVAGIIAKITH